MRVVFMGTPQFAVASLRALAERHDVVAAYTRPDAVSGRGAVTRPSPVKSVAHDLGIAVRQPRTLRDAEELAHLRSLAPDIVIVAAYGIILPPDVLYVPPLDAVNVHASLLPRWRGAAPIQRAILAGDLATGVSIMRIEASLDAGPYCAQAQTSVGEKSAADLTEELAELGAQALLKALPSIADDSAVWTPQDESKVTYADKVSKADVAISPDLPVAIVVRRVRASLPAAPSRVVLAGRGTTLLDARPATEALAPGALGRTKTALLLGVCDGSVEVMRVKPDGKAEMDAAAWARGVRDFDGSSWEAAP